MDYIVEKLHLNNIEEINEVKDFLSLFSLTFEDDIDYTVVIRKSNKIVATCSKSKDILKCFAIEDSIQGEGITNLLIKAIQDRLFHEGLFHSFIFTKPIYEITFKSFGYKVIAKTEKVILLEYGFNNIEKNLDSISNKYNINSTDEKTALVMNCNPFTLGHRYLIDKASLTSKEVLIFIVEEDKSIFPFKDRFDLVVQGVKDLDNVKVIPGGKYIISRATFPTYFLKKEDDLLKSYTELDALIFGEYFCKKFNITKRFLGEEPYCEVTKNYNKSLIEILKKFNVEVNVISRIKDNNFKDFISASKVRKIIKEAGSIKENSLNSLVPVTTLNYLKSKEGKKVVDMIIN